MQSNVEISFFLQPAQVAPEWRGEKSHHDCFTLLDPCQENTGDRVEERGREVSASPSLLPEASKQTERKHRKRKLVFSSSFLVPIFDTTFFFLSYFLYLLLWHEEKDRLAHVNNLLHFLCQTCVHICLCSVCVCALNINRSAQCPSFLSIIFFI